MDSKLGVLLAADLAEPSRIGTDRVSRGDASNLTTMVRDPEVTENLRMEVPHPTEA